ncbi:EpsG family protein [Selenomonas ruminantium]|uniref:EpsG family protein n=1 Tax=Selenomonas ruminantium TaxID=971 RepID=A0A1M6X471_SELRU|nr:EpsG family protein [Selenomonas ruminantium]SHL00780.1 EpsG family protein [Selenomonas ruminantium]
MILLFLYIIVIALNFIFPRSKKLFIFDFFFMWILMGWNYSVADYEIYLRRYIYSLYSFATLEPLYVYLQNIAQEQSLDYNSFLKYMTFVFLLIRMIAILGMSKRHNIVVGLYLLFPYIMDITQVRMFYATSIVLLGLVFFMKDYKYSNIILIISVIIATLIHVSCIFYLLLPLSKWMLRFTHKRVLTISVRITTVLYVLLMSGMLYFIAGYLASWFGFSDKFIETVLANDMAYKFTYRITYSLEVLIFFLFMNYMLGRACRFFGNASRMQSDIDNSYGEKSVEIAYRINCILLWILPLVWFSGDIYRIQHGILVLFYSVFSNINFFRDIRNYVITYYQIAMCFFVMVFVIMFLLGNESLRESVFIPVFFDNVLLGE